MLPGSEVPAQSYKGASKDRTALRYQVEVKPSKARRRAAGILKGIRINQSQTKITAMGTVNCDRRAAINNDHQVPWGSKGRG